MLKYLIILLSISSLLFGNTTVSDANQDLITTMLAYGKEGNFYLDELFVALQTKIFKNAYLGIIVIIPLIFLVIYLLFILLTEGNYIFEVFKNSTIKWNF